MSSSNHEWQSLWALVLVSLRLEIGLVATLLPSKLAWVWFYDTQLKTSLLLLILHLQMLPNVNNFTKCSYFPAIHRQRVHYSTLQVTNNYFECKVF